MLTDFFRRLRLSLKRQHLKSKREMIEHTTDIELRDGELYIVCGATPMLHVSKDRTVQYILDEIKKIKRTRMDYEGI